MSNETRRIGLFGVTGVLIAVVIIAGFIVANNVFQVSGKGTLTIQVMDKPVELKNLNVTIDWARVQDQDGNWINLTLKEDPFYFDLLSLQNISETLSETEIPAGNYTMISMHVLTANATYLDDSTADLNVPSDVIKVLLKPQLNLEDGSQVTVLIDLQPDDLNSIAISHNLNLRPVIKAVVP
ncbi:DUF4382 domain-containing protein [Candidatus Bathyarchaeota archaeon A05DMB-2]|nr:DUF4382 domain-containing protein [Candidatus Bathyarchaeota archaeon A05DMB-2]